MIILRNYSTIDTCIQIDNSGYTVVKKKCDIRQGVGGFSDDGELLGLYVYNDKLYFQYNDKSYETKANEISCTNEILKDAKRNFRVKINKVVICNIVYKPYISPFVLTFGDDEDEFDFLLYLSNLMADEDSILNFIKGMNNLNQYDSNNS